MPIRIFDTFGTSSIGNVVTTQRFDTIIVISTGGLAYVGPDLFSGIWSNAADVNIIVHGQVYGKDGGGGIDTYDASPETSNALRADLLRGTITYRNTGSVDIVAGIENVRGTALGDAIIGGTGDNTFWGGAGADALLGRGGNDVLFGGDQNDGLDGSTGNDTLVGGFGNDRMTAGEGDDLLISDGGRDTMTGNAGIDTFVFTGPLDARAGPSSRTRSPISSRVSTRST